MEATRRCSYGAEWAPQRQHRVKNGDILAQSSNVIATTLSCFSTGAVAPRGCGSAAGAHQHLQFDAHRDQTDSWMRTLGYFALDLVRIAICHLIDRKGRVNSLKMIETLTVYFPAKQESGSWPMAYALTPTTTQKQTANPTAPFRWR